MRLVYRDRLHDLSGVPDHSRITERGTRRNPEDTQGHDGAAKQGQEDTAGAVGIRKDATLRQFGTATFSNQTYVRRVPVNSQMVSSSSAAQEQLIQLIGTDAHDRERPDLLI